MSAASARRCAIGSSGGGCSSAAVPRTPAMMTGIVIGYNSTGSRTSRLCARTSIAANSVPTAAKPTVPDASSADEVQRPAEERRVEQQRHERHQQHSATKITARMPEELADVDRGTIGGREQQRPQRIGVALSLEGAAERQRPAEGDCDPEDPAAASATSRPSRTRANANTTTTDRAKNIVVASVSRLRISMVTSLRKTVHAVRKNMSEASPDGVAVRRAPVSGAGQGGDATVAA